MKFSYGYWVNKPGVSVHGAVEIRDVQHDDKRFSAYVSPFPVTNRGQTLSGPLLTLELTAPREGIIEVCAYHFKGALDTAPHFNLNVEYTPLSVTQNNGGYSVFSGLLEARLTENPFRLEFYYNGRFLTGSDTKQLAYITSPDGSFFRERLDLSIGECIYGLGERFTPFVKNGQTVDIWNEDGGTASEIAYKSIPFYLSNRGYGVFVNHAENVSYEIASEAVSKAQFSVAGERLRYCVIGGADMKEALSRYTDLTGKAAMPPDWSFGLWLSTSFTTNYDEETVTHFIDGMLDREIPLSVFHFDCFWMREYEWCNFTWDSSQFPDVPGMLSRLHGKGLKVCVWINPYIGQKSPLFDEGAEQGYFIKRPDGSIWQWDMWQPGMAVVDFANPSAVGWYQEKLKTLLDMGVDCFKTDFGERIPTDCIYFDGSNPVKMHNYYTYLYNKTVFDLLKRERGEGEAVVFARSATAGGQQFPVHWGGDCDASYVSMAESLRGGLSLAMCGFAFWSHDIGGFESTATADLYKRWVAFGLFSTHSRLHGSSSYRVPWLFDEEAVAVLRHFSRIKKALWPYLKTEAQKACETGIPVMRPMVLEYPDDPVCPYIDRQYHFGDSLIVAPVFNEDGIADVYLPKGEYIDFFTGGNVQGGGYIRRKCDYFTLPVFIRADKPLPDGCAPYQAKD